MAHRFGIHALKSLIIFRHAKSSRNEPGLADFERPLNPQGKRDALRMGIFLRDQNLEPDLILTSTARRARETTRRLVEATGLDCEIQPRQEMYGADPEELAHMLREVPEPHARVMLVGHNPTLEELVHGLAGEEVVLPTATVAHVRLDITDWRDFALTGTATLVDVFRPKELF